MEKIVGALNLKITPRDLKSKDSKSLLNTLMSQWMPLSSAILVSVIEIVPSPKEAQPIRIPAILHPNATKQSAPISGSLEWEICSCSADPLVPVVAYISKVFSVPTKELPSFKKKRVQLTAEELREKRRLKLAALQDGGDGWTAADDIAPSLPTIITSEGGTTTVISPSEASGESLIGFARIYSGTIKVGQTMCKEEFVIDLIFSLC